MEKLGTATHGYFNLCLKCRTIDELDELNPNRAIYYVASIDGITVVDSEILISKTASQKDISEAIKNDLYDTFEIEYHIQSQTNSIL
jgi:hypothetical protein